MRDNARKIRWTENALQELERLLGTTDIPEIDEIDDSLGGLYFPWPITIKSITADTDADGAVWAALIIEFDETPGAGSYEVRMSVVEEEILTSEAIALGPAWQPTDAYRYDSGISKTRGSGYQVSGALSESTGIIMWAESNDPDNWVSSTNVKIRSRTVSLDSSMTLSSSSTLATFTTSFAVYPNELEFSTITQLSDGRSVAVFSFYDGYDRHIEILLLSSSGALLDQLSQTGISLYGDGTIHISDADIMFLMVSGTYGVTSYTFASDTITVDSQVARPASPTGSGVLMTSSTHLFMVGYVSGGQKYYSAPLTGSSIGTFSSATAVSNAPDYGVGVECLSKSNLTPVKTGAGKWASLGWLAKSPNYSKAIIEYECSGSTLTVSGATELSSGSGFYGTGQTYDFDSGTNFWTSCTAPNFLQKLSSGNLVAMYYRQGGSPYESEMFVAHQVALPLTSSSQQGIGNRFTFTSGQAGYLSDITANGVSDNDPGFFPMVSGSNIIYCCMLNNATTPVGSFYGRLVYCPVSPLGSV